MRRVRGPLARQVDNFAQNHVGVRRVVQIEAGAYIALDAAHQLALVAACQVSVSSGLYILLGKVFSFKVFWM